VKAGPVVRFSDQVAPLKMKASPDASTAAQNWKLPHDMPVIPVAANAGPEVTVVRAHRVID